MNKNRPTTPPPVVLTPASFRFYGELNDFLPRDRKHRTFEYVVKGRPAVKDTLEALGIPHTEVDVILVRRKSVRFHYQLKHGDRFAVYPAGFSVKVSPLHHLRPKPPRKARFVIDSHLGKLARHLRLLGFDCVYEKVFPDSRIAGIAQKEKRIVLTRDIGLLKNKIISEGLWVRSDDPLRQLKEVLRKYNLAPRIKPFRLCLECNGRIQRVAKSRVLDRLPDKVRNYYSRFYMCRSCRKIYWQGSHYEKLAKLVEKIKKIRPRR